MLRAVSSLALPLRAVSPLPRPALRGERVGVRGCCPVKIEDCGKRRALPPPPKQPPPPFPPSPPKSRGGGRTNPPPGGGKRNAPPSRRFLAPPHTYRFSTTTSVLCR